jgi:RNA polymerase sigma-70 factor (ECF subfamily)
MGSLSGGYECNTLSARAVTCQHVFRRGILGHEHRTASFHRCVTRTFEGYHHPQQREIRVRDKESPGESVEAIQRRAAPGLQGVVPIDEWATLYGDELERHVMRMLGSRDEARDIVQELWVTAIRSTPDFGEGSNIRAWLYRVATRRTLDVLSGRKRQYSLLNARSLELEPDRLPHPDAELRGLSESGAAAVRAGVAALPCRQRDAVWLRWIEGKDYATIAERLGSTQEAARANVYQGLKKLRRDLAGVWNDEEVR